MPPAHAAEMTPFNPLVGEFRVHYAGLLRSRASATCPAMARARARCSKCAATRCRSSSTTGRSIGRLIYEPLSEPPETVYGQGIGSNYQRQGLKLSKHFKPFVA